MPTDVDDLDQTSRELIDRYRGHIAEGGWSVSEEWCAEVANAIGLELVYRGGRDVFDDDAELLFSLAYPPFPPELIVRIAGIELLRLFLPADATRIGGLS